MFRPMRTLLSGGTVVSMDPAVGDLPQGDVLIEDGRIAALGSGVTTMLDWFHCSDRPENADAAIQALREAPGHSVFCYCANEPDIAPEITRVRSQLPDDGMALGLRGPQ